jgi:hypothetical protein
MQFNAARKIQPSSKMKERQRVYFVRDVRERLVMMLTKRLDAEANAASHSSRGDSVGDCVTNQPDISSANSLNSLAVLTRGIHYEGDHLQEAQPIVDLSLEIFVDPLAKFVKGEASLSATERWLAAVIDHIVDVSEGIRNRK